MQSPTHILLTEDDASLLGSLAFILKSRGFRVTTASDGSEALKLLAEMDADDPEFDLLITDIQMPNMNGLELITSLHKRGIVLPVLVVTGYGDKETLIELIRIGCDEFLPKPFEPEEVVAKINEVLKKFSMRRRRFESGEGGARLARDLDRYKRSFEGLRREMDSAILAYSGLIDPDVSGLGVRVAYRNQAMHELGGDYLDMCSRGEGRIDLLVADVAGHDMAASYHTVLVKAFFRESCRGGAGGASLLRLINQALLEGKESRRMVTALFVELDLAGMRGKAVSAGHPFLVRLGANGRVHRPAAAPGEVLGAGPDPFLPESEFILRSGDKIVLYSDGIPSARRVHGPTGRRKVLKDQGLNELLRRHADKDVEGFVGGVWGGVMEHCRHKQTDDMLLMAVQI